LHIPESGFAALDGPAAAREQARQVLFGVSPAPLTATASWLTTLAATWTERLQLLKQQAERAGG
jgi:hypothetical protein